MRVSFQISDVQIVDDYVFTFTLTTDAIAPFVWLEATFWENDKCKRTHFSVAREATPCPQWSYL